MMPGSVTSLNGSTGTIANATAREINNRPTVGPPVHSRYWRSKRT